MIGIELYAGAAGFKRVAQKFGIEVVAIDIRRRKGVCEPDLRLDVQTIPSDFFTSLRPFVMWIALPCDIWSNASGDFFLTRDYQPKNKKAEEHLRLLFHTLEIIERSKAVYWFIENPRGRLRNFPPFVEWLRNQNAIEKVCTLSSYGFPTVKPTNIFTNFHGLELRELAAYGRGAKNPEGANFKAMTTVQRQRTPERLYKEIIEQIIKKSQGL